MRIYQRLIDEHGMTDVSYSVLGRYVRERKPQILAAAGRGPAKAFIPQTHRPGRKPRSTSATSRSGSAESW
ncbi:hypothetical protein [Nocardia brevicatena]|uniref:hypothetical protein n=1 Tax=Nocardia brevicatena TaxID=37327 RepID=UPI0002E6B42B|nr:hypothetical protein [Nocardia brevicatena]